MLSRGPAFVGEVITCRVNLGSSAKAIEREVPVIAAALGARDVRVRQQRENASLLELLVVRNETLQQPVDPTLLLSRYRPSLYDCVPLGIDENGEDVVIGLVGRHLLIGGETGAGKSGSLSVVLAAAALDPNCDIWCFDGKLVELAAWRPVAKRVVGSDMEEANEALDELLAEMNRRYEVLLARKGRKVEQGDGERTLLVVIDELAFYVANGDKKAAQLFSEKLRDLVARARAAGIVVVAATQKPSADLIPSALRDNFGFRLAHRCATREASDTILGSGWAAEQISASTIDPRLRGVGYLLADGGVPHRIRSMYLDDEAISSIVTAAVARRDRT
jgi:S-DNA-T family DNA segregation ATPase FtsK/SpoIIIE